MAYSFTHTLTAGTPENVTDVMDNFTGLATDTEYAYSVYKTIVSWLGGPTGAAPSATLFLTSSNAQAAYNASSVFYLDPADYTSASRTKKYRVRAYIATNQTAPAINFTFGLYPATFAAGAAGADNTYGTGSVVSGSTVVYNTPAASTQQQGNSGDFTAPVAGYYVLLVEPSGSAAASSRLDLRASLQMRQV